MVKKKKKKKTSLRKKKNNKKLTQTPGCSNFLINALIVQVGNVLLFSNRLWSRVAVSLEIAWLQTEKGREIRLCGAKS